MTTTPRTVAIVGGGLAGAKTAEALRAHGFDGKVTLVGDEPHRPYERPALSKALLTSGSVPDEELYVHGPTWYADHDVELLLDSPVHSVDLAGRHVMVGAGARLGFDVAACSPPAAPPDGCPCRGPGWPGCTTCAPSGTARPCTPPSWTGRAWWSSAAGGSGWKWPRPPRRWGRRSRWWRRRVSPCGALLGDRVATLLLDAHRSRGVDRSSPRRRSRGWSATAAATWPGSRSATGARCLRTWSLVGIGAVPTVALAQQAGLAVQDGVVVDEHLRTSDPDVFAVGDIANAWHPTLDVRLRVEHWATALNQPATVAASVTGHPQPYGAAPVLLQRPVRPRSGVHRPHRPHARLAGGPAR